MCKKTIKMLSNNKIYATILLKIGKENLKMKEASGELNMTLVTIVAVAAIGGLIYFFLPTIKNAISNAWTKTTDCQEYDSNGKCIK